MKNKWNVTPKPTKEAHWTPLEIGKEIPVYGRCVVTRALAHGKDVVLGFPGWNYYNNRVIAYMEIKGAAEERAAWYSPYWGDDEPKTAGWHLVTLLHVENQQKTRFTSLFYEQQENEWLAVPDGWEVFAYRPFPKPYTRRGGK